MKRYINTEQADAIKTECGCLVVIAGPGTGKTHTLAKRCQHLIHRGAEPRHLLLLTHTTAAADEMRRRVARNVRGGGDVQACTLHSYAYQMLRQYGHLVGLDGVLRVSDKPAPGVVTYDGLLDHLLQLLQEHPQVVQERHLLVDEMQDVNQRQLAVIHRLRAVGLSLTLVGDPCQSIYSFGGAVPAVMAEVSGSSDRVVHLVRSYRTGQLNLDFANSLLTVCPEMQRCDLVSGYRGNAPVCRGLSTEQDEARYIAGEIHRLLASGERRPEDIAVLYSMTAHSFRLQIELLHLGLPFYMRGGSLCKDASCRSVSSEGRVLLSTVHSVKGQEFPVVFVMGLSEGRFSAAEVGTAAYSEALRLLYVACTREKEQLYVTAPLSYMSASGEVCKSYFSSLLSGVCLR